MQLLNLIHYIMDSEKKIMSHPLLEKNPTNKPLAEHVLLVALSTGGESTTQHLL